MANGRKYTTYFNADSSGFKKGTDEAVQALQKMNKELVNNQYRQKDCNKAISDAQKELKKTEKEIEKLEKEQKEKGKLDEKDKKLLDDLKAKHKQLGDTIESEKVKLAQLRTAQAGIKGTISDLSKEIAGNNKEWTTLKATIANLASDSLELLARKLLEIGKAVISTGEQFTASMSEVGAISGASAEQLELLEQTAREYGATTKFSASESAQALKYMALAGWDTQQSIEALGSVLDLAAAGNMDLARASDIVTDYITAFGLSAKDSAHFADVMAYAMAHSNTNVEQLGEAYKNCAASAASMGYSVEEVTAVLMTMANAGVKGGEAGTTLNTIMTRLATDTKGCASALEEMGIKIFDENGNLKSLSEILQLVTSAFDGMNDKQQAALSKVIAGQNQYTGFQTILKGLSEKAKETGQSFGDYSKALEECDGTSKGMAKTMSDNLSGDLKTMQSAFEELALKIYDSGETPLRDIVQFVTNSVVPGIESLINNLDKIIPVIVGVTTAMTGFKLSLAISTIVGKLETAFKGLTLAKIKDTIQTKLATLATKELNAAQAANVIGIVISLIASLVSWISVYSSMTHDAAESTEKLDKSQENYLKTLQDVQEAAREKEKQNQADIETLKSLESVYDELRNKVNLTTGEERQLDSAAKELAKTLGISIEQLKDKDGKYKSLTGSIDEYIESLREEIKLEANKEGLKAAYTSYYDASEGYSKSKKELDELIEKNSELEKKRKDFEAYRDGAVGVTVIKEEYDAFKEYDAKLKNLKATVGDYAFQVTQAADAVGKYEENIGSATSAEERAGQLIDKAINGLGEVEKKTSSSGASIENTTDVIKGSADAVGDYTDKVEEYADRLLKGEDGYTLKGFYALFKNTGEAADYLEDKLQSANKNLEDNRTQIKNTQDEIEALRKALNKPDISPDDYSTKYTQLEDAKKRLAQLRTEQVGLKEAVKSAEKEYKSASWAAKSYDEKISELAKDSANVRKQLKSLSDIYGELQNGQAMSFDTLLSLIEKYPQYATELANANGNISEQKRLVELLYEAEKNEAVAKLTNAKAAAVAQAESKRTEISALKESISSTERYINVLKNMNLTHSNVYSSAVTRLSRMRGELSNLNTEFDNAKLTADSYNDAINALSNAFRNFNIKSSGNSNTSADNNYSPSQSNSGSDNVEWTWSWLDEQATGSTSAQARTELVERVHQLGKINDRELKAEYEKILREEQLTADESYNIRLKLYNMTSSLAQKEEDENKKRIQKRLDYAKAAYEKIVKGEVEYYQKESDSIKSDLDKKLKEIDEEKKQRQQKEEDEQRQKELKEINDELFYNSRRMTEVEKQSLLRRKQDIINEQANAEYERNIELRKTKLQEEANTKINKNTEAIERLNKSIESAAYYLAKMNGTATASQIVNNSDNRTSYNYISSGFGKSYDELIREFTGMIY